MIQQIHHNIYNENSIHLETQEMSNFFNPSFLFYQCYFINKKKMKITIIYITEKKLSNFSIFFHKYFTLKKISSTFVKYKFDFNFCHERSARITFQTILRTAARNLFRIRKRKENNVMRARYSHIQA